MCALVSQSLLGRCQIHVKYDQDSQPSQRCILKNILKNLTLPTFFYLKDHNDSGCFTENEIYCSHMQLYSVVFQECLGEQVDLLSDL